MVSFLVTIWNVFKILCVIFVVVAVYETFFHKSYDVIANGGYKGSFYVNNKFTSTTEGFQIENGELIPVLSVHSKSQICNEESGIIRANINGVHYEMYGECTVNKKDNRIDLYMTPYRSIDTGNVLSNLLHHELSFILINDQLFEFSNKGLANAVDNAKGK